LLAVEPSDVSHMNGVLTRGRGGPMAPELEANPLSVIEERRMRNLLFLVFGNVITQQT
jgi:hypothetical protein